MTTAPVLLITWNWVITITIKIKVKYKLWSRPYKLQKCLHVVLSVDLMDFLCYSGALSSHTATVRDGSIFSEKSRFVAGGEQSHIQNMFACVKHGNGKCQLLQDVVGDRMDQVEGEIHHFKHKLRSIFLLIKPPKFVCNAPTNSIQLMPALKKELNKKSYQHHNIYAM